MREEIDPTDSLDAPTFGESALGESAPARKTKHGVEWGGAQRPADGGHVD